MNRLEKEIKRSISEWSNLSNSRSYMRKAFHRTRLLISARAGERVEALERNLGIHTEKNKKAGI